MRAFFTALLVLGCSSESFNMVDKPSDAGSEAASSDAVTEPDACPTITVISAIYANNCNNPIPLQSVAQQCDGKSECSVAIDFKQDPGFDPASGCPKDLRVNYLCGTVEETTYVPAEAYKVTLDCCK